MVLSRCFHNVRFVCLFVGCLSSQQHASVSQGRICTDNFTCCHTEIEAADQTFHLTQSQYTDTGLTSPSADPITPGAWQGSPQCTGKVCTVMDTMDSFRPKTYRTGLFLHKIPWVQTDSWCMGCTGVDDMVQVKCTITRTEGLMQYTQLFCFRNTDPHWNVLTTLQLTSNSSIPDYLALAQTCVRYCTVKNEVQTIVYLVNYYAN